MDEQQYLCRFTLNSALPAEEIYIGGSNNLQNESSDSNFFYLTGQTLYDLKRSFPLQGNFHFRCLSENGNFWVDLLDERDDLFIQNDNTIDIKVLDIGALNRQPKIELTYEEEVDRIEKIENERIGRPYCIVPNNEDLAYSSGGNNISVSQQAKAVAKKGMQKAANLASKMKGFFR